MKKILVLGFLLAAVSANADVICSDVYGQRLLTIQNDKFIISMPEKELETLTIQLSAADGRFVIADAREKQNYPARGGFIADSTVLTFSSQTEKDQAVLQYKGNSYIVMCGNL